MEEHDRHGRSGKVRERLRGMLHRAPGGHAPGRASFRARRTEGKRQLAWAERLTDPDPAVVLAALVEAASDPELDCSPAASHTDPEVRLAAVSMWQSLDDDARELLRNDADDDVASAASPELACRVFVSQADTDDHARMHGVHLSADERLTMALGTVGRRNEDGELRHVGCVLAAVDVAVAGLRPDETRLAERAATVAAAALRSVGVTVPLDDERLAPTGRRLYGTDAGEAWQDRLTFLSSPPASWDWDGSRERATERATQLSVAQQYEWDEQRRQRDRESAALEAELQDRIRRGQYPALWQDRPRQTDRPGPRRRPPGF